MGSDIELGEIFQVTSQSCCVEWWNTGWHNIVPNVDVAFLDHKSSVKLKTEVVH